MWFTGAVVTMYPGFGNAVHLSGSLFTSYGADLTFPAWFYIQLRRRPWRMLRSVRWFGSSPELAAGSIFAVGLLSELGQFYWPKGIFRGTFDALDIVAYAVSLFVCYAAERHEVRRAAEAVPDR